MPSKKGAVLATYAAYQGCFHEVPILLLSILGQNQQATSRVIPTLPQ